MPEIWREKEKLMRNDAIVSAAEKLFSENGFERTAMEDIAAEAGFTKRTLYQYYDGKQEIYYAVVVRGMHRLLDELRAAAHMGQSGLEQFRLVRRAAWQCAQHNPNTFRVMARLGQARSAGADSSAEQQIAALSAELFLVFRSILDRGRTDGSIPNTDESEDSAIFFILVGTLARLCEVGGAYAALLGDSTGSLADKVIGLTDRLLIPRDIS